MIIKQHITWIVGALNPKRFGMVGALNPKRFSILVAAVPFPCTMKQSQSMSFQDAKFCDGSYLALVSNTSFNWTFGYFDSQAKHQLPCETKICVQSQLALDSNLGSAPRIALESEKPFARFVCVSHSISKGFWLIRHKFHGRIRHKIKERIRLKVCGRIRLKLLSRICQNLWRIPPHFGHKSNFWKHEFCDGSHLASDTNPIQTENINFVTDFILTFVTDFILTFETDLHFDILRRIDDWEGSFSDGFFFETDCT